MYTGTALFDVRWPEDVNSLKAKRSYVRPVVAALRKLDVAVAEVGDQDVHRRSQLGVAAVAGDSGHIAEILQRCERLVAGRPELELLSVHHRRYGEDD